MNEKDKPFSAKRWTDIPQFIVVGHSKTTEEENEKNAQKMEEIMRYYGVLEPNEHVRAGKIIRETEDGVDAVFKDK